MKYIYIIIFITIGMGIPIIHAINTSHPKNILKRIIKELKENPKELWYQYFTTKGLENWQENNLEIEEFENLHILEYNYSDFAWSYKVKTNISSREDYYIVKLIKFPDIRAKSRWIVSSIDKI